MRLIIFLYLDNFQIDILSLEHSGFPRWLSGKESACRCRRHRFDSHRFGPGGSLGEGNGNSLLYSCLKNPHGQRSQACYSPWSHRVRHNLEPGQQLLSSLTISLPTSFCTLTEYFIFTLNFNISKTKPVFLHFKTK